MLTLYFLRHGQTNFSKDNRFCGWIDPPLSETGEQMAQAFANAHQSFPWKAIYTSTSIRAQQTAHPLAEKVGLSLQTDPNLREISYGDWEGMLHEEAKQKDEQIYQLWKQDPATYPPKGGETAKEVATRAQTVLQTIQNCHSEGPILVVSHKATLRILICSLLGIDLRYYRERLDYPVASLTCFEFSNNRYQLKSFGDISYLPKELQNQPGT